MTSAFYFEEGIVENALSIKMRLKAIKYDAMSEFQRVQVIETYFGTTLVLDGKTQSTEFDEKIYHETLVHPAMLQCLNPQRVYIGGGGELATARECLRWPVQEVVMVDLDKDVVDVCRRLLPSWNDGATDDPRLKLVIGDARKYLVDEPGTFDLIVLDISDPIEAGPAVHLYTKEFYDIVKTKLNPGGVVVTQSGPAGVFNFKECFTAIHNTLKVSFDHVSAFSTSIPSFGSEWGFNLAFDGDLSPVDSWPASKIQIPFPLHHYDGGTHVRLFNLPKIIRDGLQDEHRVITEDNPVFMY